MKSLAEMAVEVLSCADGRAKTALSHAYAAAWFAARNAGQPLPIGSATPPDFPARPDRPELLDPRDVPRRRPGSPAGRLALLHAVAHIELNAIDLAWDIVARFAPLDGRPRILLGPHLDTVGVANMTIDPFGGEIHDGKIWGRGASDTKGPMAAPAPEPMASAELAA